jgi:phage FluMu gp28-like protein
MKVLPTEPQGGFRVAKAGALRPEHAKQFTGGAKNIPLENTYWLWYQHRWIHDKSLMRIMEKSRRVGISYSTAYDYVRAHSRAEHRTDTWFSSRDEVSALEFQRYCNSFASAVQIGAKDLGEVVYDSDKKLQARVLAFANQTRIHSLSGNPDAMASKGGAVGLDEFALRDDPRAAYAIAGPTIDWGGRLSIISTHRGEQNFFNRDLLKPIFEKGNPMRWSHHKVTLQDALDQGFLWKLQSRLSPDDERQEMDEAEYFDYQKNRAADMATFLQEYMCQPEDEDTQFLPYTLIAPCVYSPLEMATYLCSPVAGRLFYVGVDVGETHDLTVIWLLERVGNAFFTRGVKSFKKTRFNELKRDLWTLLSCPGVVRCCIDKGGIGADLAQTSREKFGYLVEPVHFTGPVKESMAYPLRTLFEEKLIHVPDDPVILSDLRSIRKTQTPSGNVRLDAERTKTGHGDHFWALALAVHAGLSAVEMMLPLAWRGNHARSDARRVRTLE